jgi:hypothetical protein
MDEQYGYIEVADQWGFGPSTEEPIGESISFPYTEDPNGLPVWDTLNLRYGPILRGCKIRARWDEVRQKWIVINFDSDFNTPIWVGLLTDVVPPNGVFETECVKLQSRTNSDWYYDVEDPPESGNPVNVWAANVSMYSSVRGSEEYPIRVWGRLYTVGRPGEEEDETIRVKVFEIMGFIDPLAGAKHFAALNDNNRGQALIHHHGSPETIADGGPCGDESEPPAP